MNSWADGLCQSFFSLPESAIALPGQEVRVASSPLLLPLLLLLLLPTYLRLEKIVHCLFEMLPARLAGENLLVRDITIEWKVACLQKHLRDDFSQNHGNVGSLRALGSGWT